VELAPGRAELSPAADARLAEACLIALRVGSAPSLAVKLRVGTLERNGFVGSSFGPSLGGHLRVLFWVEARSVEQAEGSAPSRGTSVPCSIGPDGSLEGCNPSPLVPSLCPKRERRASALRSSAEVSELASLILSSELSAAFAFASLDPLGLTGDRCLGCVARSCDR
jgi:hypothetical protein